MSFVSLLSLSLSLSLALSLSHTHTHTHFFSLFLYFAHFSPSFPCPFRPVYLYLSIFYQLIYQSSKQLSRYSYLCLYFFSLFPFSVCMLECSLMVQETEVQSQIDSFERFRKCYFIPMLNTQYIKVLVNLSEAIQRKK